MLEVLLAVLVAFKVDEKLQTFRRYKILRQKVIRR